MNIQNLIKGFTIISFSFLLNSCQKANQFCNGCDVLITDPGDGGSGNNNGGGGSSVVPDGFSGGGDCHIDRNTGELSFSGGQYLVRHSNNQRNYQISYSPNGNGILSISLTTMFVNPSPIIKTEILSQHSFLMASNDRIKVEISYVDKTITGYDGQGHPVYNYAENHSINDILYICGSNAILSIN